MKKAVLLLLVAVHSGCSFCQKTSVSPLSIGEVIPDLAVTINIGDTIRDIHLRDFEGKVLIFDLWSTNCVTCIKAMPKMLKLQQQFRDRVKIILVAPESAEYIRHYWVKYGNRFPNNVLEAGQELTFITSDTTLYKLFPAIHGIPLHAWIDTVQRYIISTFGNSTTVDNIQKFLEGEKVKWDVYQPAILTDSLH